jgi:8-oxo-dGTP pyrophosphatase MutT (NUDIX family)
MKDVPKVKKSEMPRRQYAALPYRFEDRIEIMLISSRETRRWVLPKGWPMKGRKPYATAAREALEEAGVVGRIAKESVGAYRYIKRMKNGAQQLCDVTVFPMRVERQRKTWPEMDQRTTKWFPLDEAAAAVGEPELQAVIRNFEAISSKLVAGTDPVQ